MCSAIARKIIQTILVYKDNTSWNNCNLQPIIKFICSLIIILSRYSLVWSFGADVIQGGHCFQPILHGSIIIWSQCYKIWTITTTHWTSTHWSFCAIAIHPSMFVPRPSFLRPIVFFQSLSCSFCNNVALSPTVLLWGQVVTIGRFSTAWTTINNNTQIKL